MIYALFILFVIVPGLLISWWVISLFRVFARLADDRKNDLSGTWRR